MVTINDNILNSICKSAGIKPLEEHKEVISHLIEETIKLGVFTTNYYTEKMFEGLIPFVKTYVEEVVEYGKNPDNYIKKIAKKLKKRKLKK